MRRTIISLAVLAFSLPVMAEEFYMQVKETEFFRYEVFINGELAIKGGTKRQTFDHPVGGFLVGGPNQVKVCFTPNQMNQWPRAKDLSKVTIQSQSQREIASARKLSNEVKYYVYALAPHGNNISANSQDCKEFGLTVNDEQVAEFQKGKKNVMGVSDTDPNGAPMEPLAEVPILDSVLENVPSPERETAGVEATPPMPPPPMPAPPPVPAQ